MNLAAVLEGLLFVVGEDGLSTEEAMKILEIDQTTLVSLIQTLQDSYVKEERGIRLSALGNHLKLTTKKEHISYYQKLVQTEDDSLLSQAALETLAIIAYNQPITRIMVDEIRGISSSHMMRRLLSKGLIQECGRSDAPGKPILYQVTKEFLDYFGLSSVEQLPVLESIEEVKEEKDLYESKYKEIEDEKEDIV